MFLKVFVVFISGRVTHIILSCHYKAVRRATRLLKAAKLGRAISSQGVDSSINAASLPKWVNIGTRFKFGEGSLDL